MTNKLNEGITLLRRGWVDHYESKTDSLFVKLNNAPITSANPAIRVQGPHSLFFNNGLFMGTYPVSGTPVVIGYGSGDEYFFVSFLVENSFVVPKLKMDELLIHANSDTKITLNKQTNDIIIGSSGKRLHINTNTDVSSENYISSNFENQFQFTQATRNVNGIVKRDLDRNKYFDQSAKLESDDYFEEFKVISLDPFSTHTSVITGSNKNPAFVESRELVYEFEYSADIVDDLNESILYGNTGTKNKNYKLPNRRISRADTLSLTLSAPNYLMETIKGTVIDAFGNILDLNRYPLPIGKDQNTISASKSTDKVKSFLKIKELQRKSLAFHFEINSRKDLTGSGGKIVLPDITKNNNYSRNRSRFFIDIDKEGQFKLNVPASSEKGNIPLLTRYENFSTVSSEDDNNPNKFIRRDDNLDILQDSFASGKATPGDHGYDYSKERGSIEIKSEDKVATPIDRITQAPIRHGTVFHDILNTCFIHQNSSKYMKYVTVEVDAASTRALSIANLKDIVSKTINISGDKANAGGRSGSLNFDGSLEMNIGANTVDRQSLWLDTAGGIVGNIGRDLRDNSAVIGMDGHFFLQVGGFGIKGDSRFVEKSGMLDAILDLRVANPGGFCHIIRVDKQGVTIMTPGDMQLHAGHNMVISADGRMRIECANLVIQGRPVMKDTGGSI